MENKDQNHNVLSSIGWFFAKRYRVTSIFFILLLIVGGMFYFSVLRREGFPVINLPVSAIQGTYFVNDSQKVDREVVQPITRAIGNVDGIKEFTASADRNFYSVIVQFNDDINVDDATKQLNAALKEQAQLPQNATSAASAFRPSKFDNKYDLLLAVYDTKNSSYDDLTKKAMEGKLDPVIGRDAEIERALRILSRRQKNNPLFLGEPGVGKTALANALAQRLAEQRLEDSSKR